MSFGPAGITCYAQTDHRGGGTAWNGWLIPRFGWTGTLILLEIVLGIDNLIFIAILVDKLPPEQRNRARMIGLSLALLMRIAMSRGISWLQTLTAPLFTLLGTDISVRGLILIAGGLFLLLKATTELHARLEGMEAGNDRKRSGAICVLAGDCQDIVILDIVFSFDLVVTAVGMIDQLAIMVVAVFVAIVAMMVLSGPLTSFVGSHPP